MMEDKRLKQRLIGAIVLVSLGVIFIPMLLKGPDSIDTPIISSNIPPKPERKTEVIPLKPLPPKPDKAPVTSIPVEKASPKPSPEAEQEETAAAVTDDNEVSKEDGTQQPDLSGWSVQVGSFSRKSNALSLEGRLRKAGYAAYVEAYQAKSGLRYRVRVGPELSEEKAKSVAAALKRKLGMDGFIVHLN
ncbi:MAG: SPOR domain-containing protein [Gammaproteobacteria bacterium]|nr:SPOR domain-containing protein [Gammaproteobacteria bacterium]